MKRRRRKSPKTLFQKVWVAIYVLKCGWSFAEAPIQNPKKVLRLHECSATRKSRAPHRRRRDAVSSLPMTLYATGARRAKASRQKI
jgi:hypothetical protein